METPTAPNLPPLERSLYPSRFEDAVFWVLAAIFFVQIWLMVWLDLRG